MILENDIRDDDAEAVINALRMTKGVLSVQAIDSSVHMGEIIANTRRDAIWRQRLIDLLQEMNKR